MKLSTRFRRPLVAALAMACGCVHASRPVAVPPPSYWPTDGWRSASPESQGLDSSLLAEAIETIRARGLAVHSVSIVVNGVLVLDACFYPYDCTSLHDVASVTKSVTSTLVGIAIDDGAIAGVDQPARPFFPEVPAEPTSKDGALSIEDLLAMRAGLACGIEPGERELFAMLSAPDWNRFVLGLPRRTSPGHEFAYCSGGTHLLSSIVTRATHEKTQDFARRRLFEPLGIRDIAWPTDPAGVAHGWGDLELHPHDMLKLGFLMLNGGRWDGKQVVSERWVSEATRPHARAGNDDYGYGWWLPRGDFEGVLEARGRGGQRITVWPAHGIVAALTGADYPVEEVVPLLVKALRSDGPLPANAAGEARLATALAAARDAPPAHEVPPGPLAGFARAKSDQRYPLATNPLGLESVVPHFADGSTASLEVVVRGKTFGLPIGLDGVPRFGERGPTGHRTAATGEWVSEDAFRIHYSEPTGPNSFDLTLRFGTVFVLWIEDPSHVFDLNTSEPSEPCLKVRTR